MRLRRRAGVGIPVGARPVTTVDDVRVLILPGWLGSGPSHWQSHWEREHGYQRVEQHDWHWPRRGDWMARLDDVVAEAASDVAFAAHSLGCHLVAAWAAKSALAARTRAALLVAPPDIDRPDLPPQLCGWRPASRAKLPFPSVAVLSENDPFCALARGRELAAAWGCTVVEAGPAGHLNADSGLGSWPEAHGWLHRLCGGASLADSGSQPTHGRNDRAW